VEPLRAEVIAVPYVLFCTPLASENDSRTVEQALARAFIRRAPTTQFVGEKDDVFGRRKTIRRERVRAGAQTNTKLSQVTRGSQNEKTHIRKRRHKRFQLFTQPLQFLVHYDQRRGSHIAIY